MNELLERLLFVLIPAIIIGTALQFWIKFKTPKTKEEVRKYLEGYYKKYREDGNFEKGFYVPEDAICYIKKRMPGVSLSQIDEVVNQHFKYQESLGLVGGKYKGEFPIKNYNPIPYIMKHKQLSVTKEQIKEMLDLEEKYMNSIGIVV